MTCVQRRKEEAADYRYFPEPDLVPVVVDAAWLERMRAEMGELPAAQRTRLAKQYGLSAYDAGVLTQQGRALVAYFEEAARRCGDAKAASNWVTNQVLATLKERKQEIADFPLIGGTAGRADRGTEGDRPEQAGGRGGLQPHARRAAARPRKRSRSWASSRWTAGALAEIVRRAIAANPKAVADYKKGKAAAADAIKGAVMRETKGAANAEAVQQLILEELQKA